jgi:hypothetical protein
VQRWIGMISHIILLICVINMGYPFNRHVPVNAIILTPIIGCIIAVMHLGSPAEYLNLQTISEIEESKVLARVVL